jgi:N-methylhydantoinase A
MHYLGQTHTVTATLPVTLQSATTGVTREIIRSAFEAAYSSLFSRLLGAIPVRIVSLRTAAIGRRPPFDISVFAPAADNSIARARRGTRRVWFAGGWHDADIWSRLDLPAGAVIAAPAILEQPDATIVIDSGLQGRVDDLGNVIVERTS